MKRDFQRLPSPHFFSWAFMAVGLLLGSSLPGRAITITPTFDSSITSDPNAATIEATINAAIQIYENVITDPITVTIEYKEMTSGLGSSSTYIDPVSYQSYYTALSNSATSINDGIAVSSLPKTVDNPVNNDSTINLQLPNARALGFHINPPPGKTDGTISLNTSIMNLSRSSIEPSKYDLMATVMHETDEVLGFGSALNGLTNGTPPPTLAIWPMDLFRYDASGAEFRYRRGHDSVFFDRRHDGSCPVQSARRGRFQRLVQLAPRRQPAPRAGRLCDVGNDT